VREIRWFFMKMRPTRWWSQVWMLGRTASAVSQQGAQTHPWLSDGAPAQIWQPLLSHHDFDTTEAGQCTDTHSIRMGLLGPCVSPICSARCKPAAGSVHGLSLI